MPLMTSEHLTLTANGLGAILTVIINLNFMLLAYFLLGFVVDELVYDGDELIHKTITTGHH